MAGGGLSAHTFFGAARAIDASARGLGATQGAFHAAHPPWVDRQVRHYLIALAYLLDCFTDLWPLGNYKRLALAEKIFGGARIRAAVDRLATVLGGWGYQDAQRGRAFPRVLCEIFLINRSPRLVDLTPAVLDGLRTTARQEKRTQLFQVQRALAALGLMAGPHAPVVPRAVIHGVAPTWIAWVHRWESTSTLTRSTRHHVRGCVLKAGRWLPLSAAARGPRRAARHRVAAAMAAGRRPRSGTTGRRPRRAAPAHRPPISPPLRREHEPVRPVAVPTSRTALPQNVDRARPHRR